MTANLGRLLALPVLTLGLVLLHRFGVPYLLPASVRRALHGRVGQTVAWGTTAFLTAVALWWPAGNTYESYRTFLVHTPLQIQGLAGLALALVPGVVAAEMWFARARFKAAHVALGVVCAVWLVFQAGRPVHLSAPDFDDFFVVDKLTATVDPYWFNDKPFFTIWDFPYRWTTATAGDLLGCFSINGWFALVFVALTALWLERALPDLLGPRWPRSPRLQAWLPWVLAFWLGPVVLSNTVPYELGCATWVLATCLALEWLRTASRAPPVFLALAALALARWLQEGGHNATAVAWLPVYVHGLLVLLRWRAPVVLQAWGAALFADGILDVLFRERRRLEETLENFDGRGMREVILWGLLPLVAALGVAWFTRRPATLTVRRFAALALERPRLSHVWLPYLLAGAAIYFFSNQANLGVPIPGSYAMERGHAWDYATNHARYALFFYPYLVVLVCLLLVPRGWPGLVGLGLCAIAWNAAYVVAFYRGPAKLPAAELGYRRNTRFLEAMRQVLPGLGASTTVSYLPIPRDHGDHYLIRAADPSRPFVSACSAAARRQPSQPLVVTGYSLGVIAKEQGPPDLLLAPPAALHGDVVVLRMDDFSPAALDVWCARRGVSIWNTEDEGRP
jgi:hypothetical protein